MEQMTPLETIEGSFKWLIYQAQDSDFRIISVKTPSGNKTLKGNNLPTNKSITYRFHGRTVKSTKGPCFQVTNFEDIELEKLEATAGTNLDQTLRKLVDYISSGIFPGIGKKTARNIIETFGADSLRIIKEDTMQLTKVKGISEKKACDLVRYLNENAYITEIKNELMQYGVSDDSCRKLIGLYHDRTIETVKENPYILIHDIRMPFGDVDKMAIGMGIAPNADIRLRAAVSHVLNNAVANGHTGMEFSDCGNAVLKLLSSYPVTSDNVRDMLCQCKDDNIIQVVRLPFTEEKDRFYVFPWSYYAAEHATVNHIYRLLRCPVGKLSRLDEKIAEIEAEKGIILDESQKTAIKTCLNNPFSILTGGPGTGKTTIMDFIAELYERNINDNIVLLAPSGKAARKLAESTGRPTKTIHAHLNVFDVDSEVPVSVNIRQSLIIVDEFSMVDVKLACLLFSHITNGCRVICVGDIDQLPSVGAGAVLRDMLEEPSIPQVRLTHIFRQAAESNILKNTLKVNTGQTDLVSGEDFHIHKESDLEKCKELLAKLYLQRIEEYGLENVMMLLPYRKKVIAGVDDMNKYLQELVNPPMAGKQEGSAYGRIYRVGDPVMHVNGNNELVSNGDTGIVTSVTYIDEKICVRVRINGQTISYDKETLDHLDLAYATTVHKSQGSEYASIITCLTYNHSAMLYRNIPYVAFSRGKRCVDVVCDDGLIRAIKTTKSNERVTLMKYLLEHYSGRPCRDIFCLFHH